MKNKLIIMSKVYIFFVFLFCKVVLFAQVDSNLGKYSSDLFNWKSDTFGCYGMRDLETAKKIVFDLKLVGSDTVRIKKIFGEPNKRIFYSSLIDFNYFIDVDCLDNKVTRVYCVAIFLINNDGILREVSIGFYD